MQPPGSFPGISNLATAPTSKPMINVARIELIIEVDLEEGIQAGQLRKFAAYNSITCAEWMSALARISASSSGLGAVSRFKTVSALPPA